MSILFGFVGALLCFAGLFATIVSPGDLAGPLYVVGGAIVSCLAYIMSQLDRR